MTSDNDSPMKQQTVEQLEPIARQSRRDEGFARQEPRRAAEDSARRHAATVCDELANEGHRRRRVSAWMHLSGRTLCRWRHLSHQPPCPLPRGRPPKESSPADRRAVLQWFELKAPYMGLPSLRDQFPNMPRCELADLQADYRQHFRATHRLSQEVLTWHIPGTVWAMDHSHPPGSAVDGILAEAFAVRDLGSGMQLDWEAVPDERALTTVAVLEWLIREHGPPLVIKSDNGSPFISDELASMLARHRIIWLPSPPKTPRYNGSCEAGNGIMKIHTNELTYLCGDFGRWTSHLMEVARHRANQTKTSRGKNKPTHAQRWAKRPPITESDRDCLELLIRTHQRAIIEKLPEYNSRNKNHQRKVIRQAIRRALLDDGLLTITRRSYTPPLNRKKMAKIL